MSHMHSDGDPERGGEGGWGPPHYLSGDVRYSAAPETRTGSLVLLVTFGLALPQVSGHRVVISSLTAQVRPGTAGLIFSRLIIVMGGKDWPSSRPETSSGKLRKVSGTFLSDQDSLCMKHKFSTWDLSQDREMPVNSFLKLKNW